MKKLLVGLLVLVIGTTVIITPNRFNTSEVEMKVIRVSDEYVEFVSTEYSPWDVYRIESYSGEYEADQIVKLYVRGINFTEEDERLF